MKKTLLLHSLLWLSCTTVFAQRAKIYEESRAMLTYPFSEPDPVPKMGRIYPYFRFDGYSAEGVMQDWKMVVLENDYIKVYVAPEIGGKIWGAVEKSTGQEFLYFNEVVKFRDIAMRGPWTSGGLEYNFGDIGHIPTAATPVDYLLRENPDGSVSCIVGAIDLPSRTRWNVSINLHPKKAFVETVVTWVNPTELPVTYYHWMNAAAKAAGNLEFIYPGSAYIGHDGEVGDFPINQGRNIAWYEKNNFGRYKSYHVLNAYSNFFGGYWHDDDFGFGHLSAYDDKPGKKIWIWGLSDQGMIWEDLLTDTDGQYVEYQSGKLFNQAAEGSTLTPFKHREFAAHDTDFMVDQWFPLKNTGGMVAASEFAVANLKQEAQQVVLRLSPLQLLEDVSLRVKSEERLLLDTVLNLAPLQLFSMPLSISADENIELTLGEKLLYYNPGVSSGEVDRPLVPNPNFNWESAYGKYTKGLELEKQRKYMDAMPEYKASLAIEPGFAPALNRLAMGYYRSMEYEQALEQTLRSMAIDTYDPEANYLYGLIHEQSGALIKAKSGYGIAAQDPAFRVPGLTSLARLALKEEDYRECLRLSWEALTFNARNTSPLEMLALVYRIRGQENRALSVLKNLENIEPTSAFLANELDILQGSRRLEKLLSNELAEESYLELAIRYLELNRREDAIKVLQKIADDPVASLWLAKLIPDKQATYLETALEKSPSLVFPHRKETLEVLNELSNNKNHWKLNYYRALIYWHKGKIAEARKLFLACQNEPDFAPFYLAKAELFETHPDMQLGALQQAVKLAPDDWRSNLAYAKRQFLEGNYKAVVETGTRFNGQSPAMALLYARALIHSNRSGEAVTFLKNYTLLPFEGANEARTIYHEACIRASLSAYSRKDYKTASNYAEAALEWPPNLGVGKPYDPDNRMDYYLLYRCMEKLNRKKDLDKYQNLLIQHPSDNTPALLLQALALKDRGQEELGRTLLDLAAEKQEQAWIQDWYISPEQQTEHPDSPEINLIIELLTTTAK